MVTTFNYISWWCGLYRDDGLALLKAGTSNAHRVKLKLEELYKKEGLKIKVKTNLITTDFLDVKVNLKTGTHQPYRKPGSKIVYIDYQSNHPPSVKRAMPGGIQTRLSTLSSNTEIFQKEVRPYEHELNERGYKCKLNYNKINPKIKHKRKRKRKITFYNPPWNDAVSTDVARKTFKIVQNHFKEGTLLGKLFNKKTINVSYSTTRNMEQHIKAHNRKIIGKTIPKEKRPEGCNCQKRNLPCFANGNCKVECVVYGAEVKSERAVNVEKEDKVKYIGMTEGSLKARYTQHKSDINKTTNKDKGTTKLAKHISELKEKGIKFEPIKWTIIERCKPYVAGAKNCNLCMAEKIHILEAESRTSLNSRSEMLAMCRHKWKFLLENLDSKSANR